MLRQCIVISFLMISIVLMTNIVYSQLIDNNDGTVTDQSTCLVWQKRSSGKKMNWMKALNYCERLELARKMDWRLPSVEELRSIADYSRYKPSISTKLFPNTKSASYWTATSHPTLAKKARLINFYDGGDGSNEKYSRHYVRAVRGGKCDDNIKDIALSQFYNNNDSYSTKQFDLSENNEAPQILIFEPDFKNRAIVTIPAKQLKVKGRSLDKDGIYEVTVNGIEAQLQKDGYFTTYIPLAIGANILKIKATDIKMKSTYKEFKINRESHYKNTINTYTEKQRRLALVIGNSNYSYGGNLLNPINDAVSMKTILKSLSFNVIKYENCSQRLMKRAMDEFGNKLKNFDVGLFFYAGHGVQVKGSNFLIPIDAKLENENDVEYDCVRADRILAKMESAGTKANIVILDACRDNPFERSWQRGTKGKGLAFMNAPSGSLIAYATSPGSTASDGSGVNGLYTSSLLEHIGTPNITIEDVFKRVRATVLKRSGNKQTPWESTSLTGYFYFKSKY